MLSEKDFNKNKFPYNESNKFEYKQSIVDKNFHKYLETLCGFLNTNGGCLIFGIGDSLDLLGIKIKQKELDSFILRIDSIINSGQIIGINIENKQIIKLKPNNIIVKQITNTENKKFLVIETIPEPNIKYQLSNGTIYYRLGASNYFEKTEKIYKQSDFENACKNIQIKADDDNKSNIQLFQKTLDDKNKQIDELNKKLDNQMETNVIYQKYLESSINNSNKLVNYNQNNSISYTDFINLFFSCLK